MLIIPKFLYLLPRLLETQIYAIDMVEKYDLVKIEQRQLITTHSFYHVVVSIEPHDVRVMKFQY